MGALNIKQLRQVCAVQNHYDYYSLHMLTALASCDTRGFEKHKNCNFSYFSLDFGNGNITISCAIHLATH